MFEELISHCAYEPLTCTARLALVGALDMGSVPVAVAALADALVYCPQRIDVDLALVTFCDCTMGASRRGTFRGRPSMSSRRTVGAPNRCEESFVLVGVDLPAR